MYPQRELTRLAHRKAALQRDIALRRAHCVAAAARVAQPLIWLDRAIAFWKKLAPLAQFAAVPLGLLVQRTIFRRRKILGSLVRWGPLFYSAMRGMNSADKSNSVSSNGSRGPR